MSRFTTVQNLNEKLVVFFVWTKKTNMQIWTHAQIQDFEKFPDLSFWSMPKYNDFSFRFCTELDLDIVYS